jgi:hypothetical protein
VQPRRSLIERSVLRLLTSYVVTHPPVNLKIIVQKLELDYIEVNYPASRVDPTIFAPIIFTSPVRGRTAVFVGPIGPKGLSPEQRYSIAHQLGHFVLHRSYGAFSSVIEGLVEPPKNWPSLKKNPPFSQSVFETEADIFAVKLLIPRSLLKNLPKTDRNINFVARLFEVPQLAAVPALNFL